MNGDAASPTGGSKTADNTRTIRPSSVSTAAAGAAGAAPVRYLPATIGHYRILRLLGEGGMGAVYEAEQEQPRRIVALKVIKPGLATPELLRRFEQESQALGRLQHPGIAQIYEAGAADTGFGAQPYFAMEFIRGQSLRDYAEAHHLKTRQRLEVMFKICEAVHHAHQRGIIHRDLKPGNILVDETGQPKILDFGVARVTDRDVQATRQTDLGQLVGTLAYMSPEQVLADPLELDTRSDVYSLGVILYELLAGRLPYDLSRKLHEAVRAIREEDPAPLSSVNHTYQGDIETIAAKALEKDKARRYASAADLAGDIRRYLEDQPITARPPSASYQLQKFARRHKALVAGTGTVFVVLVAGIVASTWQAMRASRAEQSAIQQRDRAAGAEQTATKERDRALAAEREATSERNRAVAAGAQAAQQRNKAVTEKQRADNESAIAKAVTDFLQNDLLAQASARTQARPDTKPDPDMKVRTALDRAAARIAGKFDARPAVEASIRQTIGETYRGLGLYPEAQRELERAVELRQRVLGEDHRDTLTSMNDLADLHRRQGKYAQAETVYTKVLEVERRVLGEEHPNTLATMNDLALLYTDQGKYVQAEQLRTKGLEVERRVKGEVHPETLTSMGNLGLLYLSQAKYAQAELILAKTLEGMRRVRGEEHPDTLLVMGSLAMLYRNQAKYVQAEQLQTKVLEVQRRVLGEEHPDTLVMMNNLAILYRDDGKYVQAEQLQNKVLGINRRVLGEEHPTTLALMMNLAALYLPQGKYEQAEALYTKVLEVQRRVLGEEHPRALSSMDGIATSYLYQSRYTQAEPLFIKVLEVRRRVLGEEHRDTLGSTFNLALLYEKQGKYAQAEPLYAKVLEVRRRVLGEEHPNTTNVLAALGRIRIQQRQYADAEPLLRKALNGREKATPDAWQRYSGQSLLGASLAGQKNYAQAEPLLVSGYEGMIERQAAIPAPERPELDQARERIVQLYQDWGKPEKAAEWRVRLKPREDAEQPNQ